MGGRVGEVGGQPTVKVKKEGRLSAKTLQYDYACTISIGIAT